MKQLIITIAAVLVMLYVGCTETRKNTNTADIREPLASFLSTKAAVPLEGTVWMAVGTDQFRRMLLFKDGTIALFYGLIWDGRYERYSDYYCAPYTLSDDATVAATQLVYPNYGERELTEILTVVKAGKGYCLMSELDTYEFVGAYNTDLDEKWTAVKTTIQPWGEE